MKAKFTDKLQEIMNERFHHDCLIALATMDGTKPWVRTVNSFYEDGAFYVITYALSNKMKQIKENPTVAICGDWFTAHGVGENLGHILREENAEMADKLRSAFSSWYKNGHTDEEDPNTCILRIQLTEGVLMADGSSYEIDFTNGNDYEN